MINYIITLEVVDTSTNQRISQKATITEELLEDSKLHFKMDPLQYIFKQLKEDFLRNVEQQKRFRTTSGIHNFNEEEKKEEDEKNSHRGDYH